MTRILFYDFETSGLPDFKAPSEAERQPHIVQAAAALIDAETRKAIASLNLIVAPDEWEIPAEVTKVHGITTEHAMQVGVTERVVVNAIVDLWRSSESAGVNCCLRVGHNEPFDARIMRIALKRYLPGEADEWKAGPAACTQRLSTPICRLAPTPTMLATGRRHYKSPNLREAFEHFTGKPMQDAHSALGDLRACMAVYWAIQDMEKAVAKTAAELKAPAASDDASFLEGLS